MCSGLAPPRLAAGQGREHPDHAGLSRWSTRDGAARDGAGNCWGSASSAPGGSISARVSELGAVLSTEQEQLVLCPALTPALCAQILFAAPNRGSQHLISSPLTLTRAAVVPLNVTKSGVGVYLFVFFLPFSGEKLGVNEWMISAALLSLGLAPASHARAEGSTD